VAVAAVEVTANPNRHPPSRSHSSRAAAAPNAERPRPRRAALGRLDLALALTSAGKHDEAAGMTLEAIKSGRLAPVDGRRAREIVLAVAGRGVPEAAEAYQAACGDSGSPPALP
jgi:hypothetical protein